MPVALGDGEEAGDGQPEDDEGEPRLGLAVPKAVGTAVVRNRMKRRLRALAREIVPCKGLAGADHVMIGRAKGATLTEIMQKMGWQKHTVRGFMAGAMKKAGYTVESFKPEGGERTYRINQ